MVDRALAGASSSRIGKPRGLRVRGVRRFGMNSRRCVFGRTFFFGCGGDRQGACVCLGVPSSLLRGWGTDGSRTLARNVLVGTRSARRTAHRAVARGTALHRTKMVGGAHPARLGMSLSGRVPRTALLTEQWHTSQRRCATPLVKGDATEWWRPFYCLAAKSNSNPIRKESAAIPLQCRTVARPWKLASGS